MSCNMILKHEPYSMSNPLTEIKHFDQPKDYIFDKLWMQREEEVKNIVPAYIVLYSPSA